MNRTTGTFLAIVVCAVLAAVAFSLTDFLGGKVYASPEEVFNASRAAVNNNDLRAWSQCLADDSRDVMAAQYVLFSGKENYEKATTKEEKATLVALMDLQKKFGLTEAFLAKVEPEAAALRQKNPLLFAQKVLAPVSDRDAFLAEMYTLIFQDNVKSMLAIFADGNLSNVKIQGKTASATVTMSQKKDAEMPMSFSKQGESWRIDLLASEEQERRRPGPGFKHP